MWNTNVNLRNIPLTWDGYIEHIILVVGCLLGIEICHLLLSCWKSTNTRSELPFLSEKRSSLIFRSLNVSWQSIQLCCGSEVVGIFYDAVFERYALNSHHSLHPGGSGSFSFVKLLHCKSHIPVKEFIRYAVTAHRVCFVFSNKCRKVVDLDFGFVISSVRLASVALKLHACSVIGFQLFIRTVTADFSPVYYS